jgi:hypothetical protein
MVEKVLPKPLLAHLSITLEVAVEVQGRHRPKGQDHTAVVTGPQPSLQRKQGQPTPAVEAGAATPTYKMVPQVDLAS